MATMRRPDDSVIAAPANQRFVVGHDLANVDSIAAAIGAGHRTLGSNCCGAVQ